VSRLDEALAAAAKARELDPMAPWTWTEEGRAHYRARRYAEAEARFRRALAIDPNHVAALDRLVQLYLAQRRVLEARRTLDALQRLPTARNLSGHRAWLDAIGSEAASARRATAQLTHPYRVLIALGDYDAAFADLEQAFEDGSLAGFALGNPELDPVRADPRFARVVARFALPVDRLVALGRTGS
jgi:tetratricopeptide (TPR) repeat protein